MLVEVLKASYNTAVQCQGRFASGPLGIRVNGLAPGTVKTRFSSVLWESESAREMGSMSTLLGRVSEPREMGGPAAFLCSEDASYVTGETLVVAGGMHSRL
jgi:dehydrogenase/reductase SDR family protein 4